MKTEKDQDDKAGTFQKRLRRGGKRITLKYPGTCKDCGADLPKGTTAKWYGRGRVYGLTCHPTPDHIKAAWGDFKPSVLSKPELALNECDFVDGSSMQNGKFIPAV